VISLAKEGCEAATLRPPADCDGVTMGKASYLPGARPYRPEAVAEYTAKGWWQGLTYGDVLDRSAAAAPQRLAVIDAQARLTYAELKERVDRFGVALRGLGIRRYDRVLLQLPNRHEFLIAFFAMHRIGAVPVLSIIRHEQREVCSLASLTAPVAWIVALRDGHRDFLPLIEAVRAEATGLRHVIVLTDGEAPPSGTVSMTDLIDDVRRDGDLAADLGRFRPNANDVAFILPTGGTTGAAKGVPRTHNSYLANVRYTGRDLGPGDVVGLATPIGHSMAQQGALGGAMLNAATLAIVESPRAEAILARIQRDRISNIGLVPTQLEDILSHADLASFDLSCLRRVRTAGADPPLNQQDVQFADQVIRAAVASLEKAYDLENAMLGQEQMRHLAETDPLTETFNRRALNQKLEREGENVVLIAGAAAGVERWVTLEASDVLLRKAPAESGVMIANPPYGERIGESEELARFYPKLGDALKQNFAGWNCFFFTADRRMEKLIRLQTSRRTPLYNGPIECRLYEFRVVAGSHRS